jgi:NDP-sugar pyrophosphorylase family protein
MVELPPVVILCGGQATRLGALTKHLPKSLIPIHGKPFIDWQLELIRNQGAREVVLCTGHLDQALREYVGNGSRYNLRISYSHENKPLGTAGALRQAIPLLPPAFFVTYGDSYLEYPWSRIFKDFERSQTNSHLSIYPNRGQWDNSNIQVSKGQLLYFSSPTSADACEYIDYGLSILTRAAVSAFPSHGDLKDELQRMSTDGQISFTIVDKRFFEIGSKQGIADLTKHLPQPMHGPDYPYSRQAQRK